MDKTERMSAAMYRELKANKPRKYRNEPIEMDGRRFDSKAECRRYAELKLLEQAGEIESFSCQPIYELYAGIKYVADFEVTGKGGKERWAEDVKSPATVKNAAFRMKARMFRELFPDVELRIIM